MGDIMQDQVLCTVKARGVRRLFGLGVLMLLGTMLIYIAIAQPPQNLGWQIFLVLMGAGALYIWDKMRRGTLVTLELTETTLRDSNGTILVEIADIKSTDRGTFAFKPSNGFILRLNSRGSRVWQPGLWWRMGKRIGVGGVTSAGETKQMAEMISGLVAMRDGEL